MNKYWGKSLSLYGLQSCRPLRYIDVSLIICFFKLLQVNWQMQLKQHRTMKWSWNNLQAWVNINCYIFVHILWRLLRLLILPLYDQWMEVNNGTVSVKALRKINSWKLLNLGTNHVWMVDTSKESYVCVLKLKRF